MFKDRPQQSGLAAFVDYIVRNNTTAILERKPPEALLDDYVVLDRLTDAVRYDQPSSSLLCGGVPWGFPWGVPSAQPT